MAGIAEKRYMPKIVESRGGRKLYKALYAQKINFSRGDCSGPAEARIVTYGRFKFGNCDINNMGLAGM